MFMVLYVYTTRKIVFDVDIQNKKVSNPRNTSWQ